MNPNFLHLLVLLSSLWSKEVDGVATKKYEFPFMVSVIYASRHHLNGVLLNESFVLANPMCLRNLQKNNQYLVKAGAHFYNNLIPHYTLKGIQSTPFEEFPEAQHPCANDNLKRPELIVHFPKYSIGLFKLNQDLNLTPEVNAIDDKVKVPRAQLEKSIKTKKSAMILGWGVKNSKTGDIFKTLQKFTGSIQSHDDCAEGGYQNYDRDTMFCAVIEGEDVCVDNCGLPLLIRASPSQKNGKWVLLGLSMMPQNCSSSGNAGKFIYFINVDVFRCWINDGIGGNCDNLRTCSGDTHYGFNFGGQTLRSCTLVIIISILLFICMFLNRLKL